MGLKKYEIITVGSDKRVRALRSWAVGGRYVNIGDIGGIVYDEKTLSQDGLCWLFSGNFGFPGARIGGDSIVDVGEATLSATGSPAVDILGSSVVVGSKLQFAADQTTADAVVLTANDFEQGRFDYAAGVNWETWKKPDPNFLRTKAPIFTGGGSKTLKLSVPGYNVRVFSMDIDGNGLSSTAAVNTGADVTLAVPAGQYFVLRLAKNPSGAIVPANATAAAVTFTGTYETKLSVVDSRLELNPANSTGIITIMPGGVYTITPGAKYPDSIIHNSKVTINAHATVSLTAQMMTELMNVNATIDMRAASARAVGIYHGVNNLAFTGIIATSTLEASRSLIQAYNCDNIVVSNENFPGLAEARAANMPFIFQGCNVPGGKFYHHAQIANTYRDINFDLATADLGKLSVNGYVLCSAEVEGMYRCVSTGAGIVGALVEAHDSVKSLNITGAANTYGTTIYKDAYLRGIFEFAGMNVFGNKVRSHPLAQVLNVQPRAVQGNLNTATLGQTVTGVIPSDIRVCIPTPFRINGANGLKIEGLSATLEALVIFVTPSNVVTAVASSSGGVFPFPAAQLNAYAAYVRFGKTGGAAITPADLAGVTVTVYNGCKIVNTGAAAVNMKGNIRVEDNAILVNASITGTGYFGGNCVMSGVSIGGYAYMKDNASIIRTVPSGPIRDLKMTDNAYAVLGDIALNGRIHLSDNSIFTPTSAGLSEGDLVMKDNAVVSGAVTLGGVLTMKDNAKVSAGALSTYGDITLCGSYNQTASKSWVGKRVIDNENEPEYDDNVKTQYDF